MHAGRPREEERRAVTAEAVDDLDAVILAPRWRRQITPVGEHPTEVSRAAPTANTCRPCASYPAASTAGAVVHDDPRDLAPAHRKLSSSADEGQPRVEETGCGGRWAGGGWLDAAHQQLRLVLPRIGTAP